LEHALALAHAPVASHVCGVLPLQRCWPGAHTPAQEPPETQVWFVHAAAAPHWPLAPHVATPLPEHCV
jgi:hypothetical protein